jgi:glycosyltransferase involved in cell wall biosynthesis
MKILLINKFLFPKGGDAVCTLATGKLLSGRGHQVVYWGMDHPENPVYPHAELFVNHVDLNAPQDLKNSMNTAANLLYSREAKEKIGRLLEQEKPDIVHLNNIAHQISPSILHMFQRHKIPVVMTLHDYKMVCASYLMMNGKGICEACQDGRYYMCFMKKCVKNSRAKSLLNTIEMYFHHKFLRIYDGVDLFIAPSVFLKEKLHYMGFCKDIVHLPNFIDLNAAIPLVKTAANRIVYFGRLAYEKGVHTLIKAVPGLDIDVRIIGTGPSSEKLKDYAVDIGCRNISFPGFMSGRALQDEIRNALIVVVPSEWYENNPRAVLEAFALGTPVIGADIGGIPELVLHGKTGWLFKPGDSDDLREKIEFCINNKGKVWNMGEQAQRFVVDNFSAQKFYKRLIEIYDRLVNRGQ